MNTAKTDWERPGGESAQYSSVGFFAALRTALAAATACGFRRALPNGSPLGIGRRWIRLEDGRLAFDVGLRLVLFDLFFWRSGLWLRLRRFGRRIKFRAEGNQHALLLVRLQTNYGLVLRVVQKFDELLEAVGGVVEVRLLGFKPPGEIIHGTSVFELQAMVFENVAQSGQQVVGLQRGTLGRGRGLALDNVAAAGAGNVHQLGALQLFDEIGEARPAVGPLIESGIELQHGGFQQPELRLDSAALEDLKSALDQRHGLPQFERGRALAAVAALRTLATIRTVAARSRLQLAMFLGKSGRHDGPIREQRFKADELVTILLQDGRGERFAAHDEHGLPILLQLVDQRDKVAVAADDGERVDMRVGERHF